ncbi:MAG: UDP-glucose 4-epimerase GalE [Bdellovibrionales bacterium GWB1_52_6]|nr:MAG: UDP-glucose 4-epimerase GalE [Bdellovibrionales bacterium GWB1_52_6]OFZ04590.1 MAG: UDP-glucose 4-epimerase GalE [Bdellovibrionales bacterium GWA1_52_35]HCM40001.1 UDP-glucose 4-epimerase GalE [Bdellovibrionales bacterium]
MVSRQIKNVLVTGGAGYIGSHAVRRLLRAGYAVTVLDDLSSGYRIAVERSSAGLFQHARFVEGSISDRAVTVRLLRESGIDAVMHFAAFIEVGESVTDPAKYYENNFAGALQLMQAMNEAEVKKLVFSSTAAVYGNPLSTPISEEQPRMPINPYGRSKLMVELAIEDFAAAYGLGYAILRYFNVAGANPEGLIGEAHEPESHLIPRILDVACGKVDTIGIFGTDYPTPDGTCIRDYIHVEDLVDAHLLAMEAIHGGAGKVFNIGSESGFSVREVIEACAKVTGKSIPVLEKPRRLGDPAILVASSAKIRNELGWQRQRPDLETIAADAWAWYQRRSDLFTKRVA